MLKLAQKKQFLECYGIFRILLGVSQLVALVGGYFLLEWTIRQPSSQVAYIVDKDILALTYLTIIVRSIFHLVIGIGITRIQQWARSWIFFGWPIMILITWGYNHSLYQDWAADGLVTNIVSVVSWFNIILYFSFIAFDYIFISEQIKKISHDRQLIKGEQGRIETKKIAVVFLLSMICFSFILYLARPVRDGFHQGFYKTSAKSSDQGKTVKTLKKRSAQKSRIQPNRVIEKVKIDEVKQIIQDEVIVQEKVIKVEQRGVRSKMLQQKRKEEVKRGMPYQKFIGFFAGICIILAFLVQAMEVRKTQMIKDSVFTSYTLLAVGFFLWCFYGLMLKLIPIYIPSLIIFIICAQIVLKKMSE